MALFFDPEWFDARLGERGLSRGVMAAAAGLSAADLALAFKDQRELSAGEVAAFAELLGVEASEVAARAGLSPPVPGQGGAEAPFAALERRGGAPGGGVGPAGRGIARQAAARGPAGRIDGQGHGASMMARVGLRKPFEGQRLPANFSICACISSICLRRAASASSAGGGAGWARGGSSD